MSVIVWVCVCALIFCSRDDKEENKNKKKKERRECCGWRERRPRESMYPSKQKRATTPKNPTNHYQELQERLRLCVKYVIVFFLQAPWCGMWYKKKKNKIQMNCSEEVKNTQRMDVCAASKILQPLWRNPLLSLLERLLSPFHKKNEPYTRHFSLSSLPGF